MSTYAALLVKNNVAGIVIIVKDYICRRRHGNLNNDSEHSSSGDETSRVLKWDGALIVLKRYSLMTIFETDTVWSFLWMIMGNLTVAGTIIEKQVLVKIKNVLDVEKISSLMKTICQFQGNMFL
jgi:hypothetical protein